MLMINKDKFELIANNFIKYDWRKYMWKVLANYCIAYNFNCV